MEYTDDTKMNFGIHQGKAMKDIGLGYLLALGEKTGWRRLDANLRKYIIDRETKENEAKKRK